MGVFKVKFRAPTGISPTVIVRRDSDGTFYDWADGAFKASGWTTLEGAAVELSPPVPPGYYETPDVDPEFFPTDVYTAYVSAGTASLDPVEIRIVGGQLVEELIDSPVSSRAASISFGDVSGATVVEIVVKEDDTSGRPLPLVSVELRSTAGVFIDRAFTNVDGLASFSVDPGTYEVFLGRIGVPITFTRPEILEVGESKVEAEFYGIPFLPFVPSTPALAVVYDYVYNLGLDPRPNMDVTAKVIKPARAYLADGPAITGIERTKTNAAGLFQLALPRQLDFLTPDVRYQIEIDRARFVQEFEAADLDLGGAIILSSLS